MKERDIFRQTTLGRISHYQAFTEGNTKGRSSKQKENYLRGKYKETGGNEEKQEG